MTLEWSVTDTEKGQESLKKLRKALNWVSKTKIDLAGAKSQCFHFFQSNK